MTFSSYVDQANSRRDVWHTKKTFPSCDFYRWIVCLISAWQQNTQNVHQKCENMSNNAKSYTKMMYRHELWHSTCKNSSRVFGFQFLGENSRFTTRDRPIKILHMKKFFGVSHITSRICLIDIRRKSHLFVVFLTQKSLKNHLTWHECTQVRKWCLVVKVLRETMRDVLSLDVFNQAHFKYTSKKDFHMEKFFGVSRTSEGNCINLEIIIVIFSAIRHHLMIFKSCTDTSNCNNVICGFWGSQSSIFRHWNFDSWLQTHH